MTPNQIKNYIFDPRDHHDRGIAIGGWFIEGPTEELVAEGDRPTQLARHSTRDLLSNPPALRHYNLGEMWRTPQAKWIGIQYALFIGCSLFGVPTTIRSQGRGPWERSGNRRVRRVALCDGGFRPFYGWLSE